MRNALLDASLFGASSPEEEALVNDFCRNSLFDVLGNKRRRYILCVLFVHGDSISCRKLAKRVAAWENESTPERITSSQYQSVYNSFYQTHFPTLEEADLIRYDQPDAMVHPTERLDDLDPFVQLVTTQREHSPKPVQATLMGGLLIGGTLVGGLALSSPMLGIASITTALLIGVIVIGALSS